MPVLVTLIKRSAIPDPGINSLFRRLNSPINGKIGTSSLSAPGVAPGVPRSAGRQGARDMVEEQLGRSEIDRGNVGKRKDSERSDAANSAYFP